MDVKVGRMGGRANGFWGYVEIYTYIHNTYIHTYIHGGLVLMVGVGWANGQTEGFHASKFWLDLREQYLSWLIVIDDQLWPRPLWYPIDQAPMAFDTWAPSPRSIYTMGLAKEY